MPEVLEGQTEAISVWANEEFQGLRIGVRVTFNVDGLDVIVIVITLFHSRIRGRRCIRLYRTLVRVRTGYWNRHMRMKLVRTLTALCIETRI